MPVERAPVRQTDGSSSVAEVVSVNLDKGIVIDAWVRAPAERALVRQTDGWVSVSVLGLELLTIQARVVVASVETYLRYAEAIELTALVAPPRGQQVIPGRGKEQAIGGPSEDEVLRDLSEHPEGLPLEAMQARLDAPLERSDDILSHLLEERKVHRDADASLQRRRH